MDNDDERTWGDYRLYMWLIRKFPSMTQQQRVFELKCILLYQQFDRAIRESWESVT